MGNAGRTWLGLGLLALSAVLLGGCSRQRTLAPPTPQPVKGRITWRGEPVRYAMVNFDPVDGHGAEADACTEADGTFELRSFANDGKKDGAVPAKYRVVLGFYDPNRFVAKRPLPRGAEPTPIPSDDWDTGVIVEVKDGDNDLNIVIP
jgi:hypothetical protein